MEDSDPDDVGPEPISIARCRELLGDEAESMSDQEIAWIRRPAETMACIVVEMYQEGSREARANESVLLCATRFEGRHPSPVWIELAA
jgi:hypothetical protein